MRTFLSRKLWQAALCLAALNLLAGFSCNGNAGDVVSKSSMQQYYLKNDWVPMPLPESRFVPGTIFTYDKKTGLRYISSLKTCGVPDSVTAPVPGNSPKLTFDTNADYGANAVLQISKVSIGPDWSKVKKTTLEYDDHGPTSMDLIKLNIWLTSPDAAQFSPVCRTALAQPNTFVAQEAYRVTKGKFTLYDQNGAKIALKGLQAGPVNIGADAHASVTQDGSLEFNEPMYTAVRRLVYINGGFQSLGDVANNNAKTADAQIIGDMKKASE